MAKKRMFSLDIIDTDIFQEMPQTSRLLYYELCMRADDDGFVGNPKKIQKAVGCSEDDFKVLISKQFIIPFETGIIVIKHWKIHNYIAKDRYKTTIYQEEKSQLYQEKNGMYTKCIQNVDKMYTKCIPSIDKNSIDKNSINNIQTKKKFVAPTLEEIQQYIQEKQLKVDGKQFYDYFTEGNWVDAKGNKVKNWKQKLLTWNKFQTNVQDKKTNYNNYEQRTHENIDKFYTNKF